MNIYVSLWALQLFVIADVDYPIKSNKFFSR